jgi:hypothetical protein
MSDVSALSQEYQTAADLSRRLSSALLLIKRVFFRLPGAESISRNDIARSRAELEQLVRAIAARLEGSVLDASRPPTAIDPERLPAALVTRLAEDNRGSPEYFVADLKGVADTLGQRFGKLTADHIKLLEHLASVADAETSRVFRQMMRRRV